MTARGPRVLRQWLQMLTPQASKQVFEFFDGEQHAASIVLDILGKAGNLPQGFLVEETAVKPVLKNPEKIVITFRPRGSLEVFPRDLSRSRWYGKTSQGLPASITSYRQGRNRISLSFADGRSLVLSVEPLAGLWVNADSSTRPSGVKNIDIIQGDPT